LPASTGMVLEMVAKDNTPATAPFATLATGHDGFP
jgi:hypothetical protein